METKKLNDSDKEIMNHESSNEDTTGVGRSYECTFCKRGFTNAQALGGHMNIHRKDKAKAKQKNQNEPSNAIFEPKQQQQQQQQHTGYHRGVEGEVKYQIYLPSSNPNMQSGNYLPFLRPSHFEGHVDANLSLRIGISPSVEDGEEDLNSKENEVDLELRLGHDP